MGFFDRFRKPTPDRFAAQMIDGLRSAGLTEELRYDRAEFRILRFRDGEKVGESNLGNMYRTYLNEPRKARAGVLARCVRAVLSTARELPKDFESARPDVRLKLWSPAVLENIRIRAIVEGAETEGMDLPHELVGEHLAAIPVFDWPESSATINHETLAEWGVSVYEALEVGRENLAETTQGYMTIGEKVFIIATGDSYDAARVTLVDRIRDFKVDGQHVAMVPNRDHLIITGADDEQGLLMMAELASKRLEDAYSLSAVPLILDSDGWRDWMPPADHPLYRRFRDMELRWLGPMYEEQKQLLDALHEKEAIDVYVGTFGAVEKKGGDLVSYCVWGEGVHTLLPVTQKVVVMRQGEDKAVALGTWQRVQEVAGHLMERTDDYPPRFRVRDIPDQALLEAIGLAEM